MTNNTLKEMGCNSTTEVNVNVAKDINIESLLSVELLQDLAKKLWGNTLKTKTKTAWQYNLQQLVISDDPITYLEQTL